MPCVFSYFLSQCRSQNRGIFPVDVREACFICRGRYFDPGALRTALGLQRGFPAVGPANVKGIEINAYAAELARVSVWISEIQWMRRNGFTEARDPILKPLETIECRDAILAPDGTEPDWPTVDVVMGNPPFLGGKLLIKELGEDYVSRIFAAYKHRVPPEADLVCYWFVKAGQQIGLGKAHRAGLVATNSIRGGANRRALQTATEGCPIFDAWSDQPWVIDGAAVRVSLVCFSPSEDSHVPEVRLEVLLRRRAFLQLGRPLLGDERARRHCGTRVNARRRRQWRACSFGATRFIDARARGAEGARTSMLASCSARIVDSKFFGPIFLCTRVPSGPDSRP